MRKWAASIVVLALVGGCGRVRFDRRAAAENDTTLDGGGGLSDAVVDGDGGFPDSTLDAGVVASPLIWLPCEDDARASTYIRNRMGAPHADCSAAACPLPVSGRVGGACDFDGDDDYGRIVNDGVLETTDGFSAALWFRADRVDSYRSFLSKPFGTDNENTWQIEIDPMCPSPPALSFTTSGYDRQCISGVLAAGRWTHVAVTYDGETKRLYVDGVLMSERSATLAFDGSDLVVGGDINSRTSFVNAFDGQLDEIYVFDHALSQQEVERLATP